MGRTLPVLMGTEEVLPSSSSYLLLMRSREDYIFIDILLKTPVASVSTYFDIGRIGNDVLQCSIPAVIKGDKPLPPSLFRTFRELACQTFTQLSIGRRVGHQLLEETFTDCNILKLIDKHSAQIFSSTFNKRDEGKIGADWEWWLTNSARSSWLGFRVQAKVLHLKTDTFKHLHYVCSDGELQSGKLRRTSSRDGKIPIYCLYFHHDYPPPTSYFPFSYGCHRSPFSCAPYGCSIVSIAHVERLHSRGACDVESVMFNAFPWHCLVCGECVGGTDLPDRVWQFYKTFRQDEEFETAEIPGEVGGLDLQVTGDAPVVPDLHDCGPRPEPPPYVWAAIEGNRFDGFPADLAGVVVIVEDEMVSDNRRGKGSGKKRRRKKRSKKGRR